MTDGVTDSQALAIINMLDKSSFIKQYCDYAQERTDAPLMYHVGCGLSLLAAASDARLSGEHHGSRIHTNLWVILAGKSGEVRKTTCIKIAKSILTEAVPSVVGSEPGSSEGLIDMLVGKPNLLIPYTEFGAFLGKTQKGYMMPVKTALTQAFDGEDMSRARANGKEIVARGPRLSLLCASTVEYLETYTEPDDWSGGFLSRFMTIICSRQRHCLSNEADPETKNQLIKRLKTFNEGNQTIGAMSGMTLSASKLWEEWNRTKIQPSDAPELVRGAVARTDSLGLKIAMLLSYDWNPDVRCSPTWRIGEREVAVATKLADLQTQSVLSMSESIAETPDLRDRRSVLRTLSYTPVTIATILGGSRLLSRRVDVLLTSLIREEKVTKVVVNGQDAFVLK